MGMSKATDAAVEAVRELLYEKCKSMRPKDYMEVMESISSDLEGNMDALREENEGMFD
jgi:hypothetical protein